MGVRTVVWVVLSIIVLAGVASFFWDDLDKLRNLALIAGTPVAIFLAVWRSMVAQKQAEVAQKQAEVAQKQLEVAQAGSVSARYQRAVEMLGHDRLPIRIGGINTLRDIALEHPNEYEREVGDLLNTLIPEPEVRDDGKVVRVPPETPEEKAAQRVIRILEFRKFSPRTMPSPPVLKK